MRRGKLAVNLLREIWRTKLRFLSIFAISFLGAAFFAGLRATSPDMKDTGDAYFKENNLADITVMSSAGMTPDDIRALEKIPGVAAVRPFVTMDAMMKMEDSNAAEQNIHLISLPFAIPEENPAGFSLPSYDIDLQPETVIDQLTLVSGRLPLDDHEVALDSILSDHAAIGDWVVFNTTSGTVRLRVVGFVDCVKYISGVERGTSTVGTGTSDGFAVASGNAIAKLSTRLPMMANLTARYTQAEILVEGAQEFSGFSEAYQSLIDGVMRKIEAYGDTTDATWYVWDRENNPGFSDYRQNTDRIGAVAELFPLIFFVVAALVALTTMTRMVEEQRIQMGTLKALGYHNGAIISEYLIYASAATVLGGVLGCVLGCWLFPNVIMSAYSIMYHLPNLQTPFRWGISLAAIAASVGCITGAALLSCISSLKEVPASLMRPKAPKAGKRVFLEHIGFVWKRLSFTSKVTVRNLLRYKKRFWMSIIGIAGSCALLLTGFGLQDAIYGIIDKQFNKIWRMDLQAFSYDPMPQKDWEMLIAQRDPENNMNNVMYCYQKTYEVGRDDETTTSANLLAINDPAAMEGLIPLFDQGGEHFLLPEEGVVISRKLSYIYDLGIGDTILLTSGNHSYQAEIAGVTENYVNHYVYCTAEYYQTLFEEELNFNGVMSRLSDSSAEAENQISASLLQDQRMYTVSFTTGIYDTITESFDILSYVVWVLILSAAGLAFVVMFNLTNINITERRREMATLLVLGFSDKELYDYVFRENNCLAVIGSLAGLLLGTLLHQFVIKTCEVDIVMFVREIQPLSFVYSALMTIGFSLLVNLFMRRKVRGIDMVESLKSAE